MPPSLRVPMGACPQASSREAVSLCPTVAGRHGGTGTAEALSCRLRYTHLTSACCQDLTVALGTSTCLEELDLSFSAGLRDDGVTLLCEGLQHSSCQLQVLR